MVEYGFPSNGEFGNESKLERVNREAAASEIDSLEGFDFEGVADNLDGFLDQEDIDWIRRGVDSEGYPLSLHELTSRIYGCASVYGQDPDEALKAANLFDIED